MVNLSGANFVSQGDSITVMLTCKAAAIVLHESCRIYGFGRCLVPSAAQMPHLHLATLSMQLLERGLIVCTHSRSYLATPT